MHARNCTESAALSGEVICDGLGTRTGGDEMRIS